MKKQEMMLNGSTLSIETGQVARQSSGSVIVSHGETAILVAVNAAAKAREDIDFFPLQVEYRERHYAGGKIPGGFFKREARPSEHEILTSRLTDRPIRPLFPKSFKNETQVIITVMSSDGENMADTLAGVGASAALMISDIPFNGPIAEVRVVKTDGKYIVNPTPEEIENSTLNLMVGASYDNISMVEGESKEVSEEEIVEALKVAHDAIKSLCELQNELLKKIKSDGNRDYSHENSDEDLKKDIHDKTYDDLYKIAAKGIADKKKRGEAFGEIKDKYLSEIEESEDFDEFLFKNSECKFIISIFGSDASLYLLFILVIKYFLFTILL